LAKLRLFGNGPTYCKLGRRVEKLLRHRSEILIGEIRGSCNCQVPKGIERAVRSWLRSQREFHLPKERKAAECWGVRP
jgi:hypothetical protein